MALSLPLIRDAIIFASLLTMLSTGLTLTYMTTKVPNFAHGDFATMSIYLNLALVHLLGLSPYLGVVPSFFFGGLIALILYIAVLRPLLNRGANYVILMIATIAYDMILISIINIIADYLNRVYKILTRLFQLKGFDLEFIEQPMIFIVAPVMSILIISLLYFFLNKTKFGIAMRAAIENPSLAEVIGININLTYAFSWFISGGLAGIAGALLPLYMTCNPDIGVRLLISVFAASIVGGLTNIYGAFLGGLVIGLAETLGTGYLSIMIGPWIVPYRPVIPLGLMLLTLLFAPRGLTGIDWRKLLRRELRA
ncbi:MAG: branched-chain amino acid ABC transporter permease [Nitrososphaerota archaeon]